MALDSLDLWNLNAITNTKHLKAYNFVLVILLETNETVTIIIKNEVPPITFSGGNTLPDFPH